MKIKKYLDWLVLFTESKKGKWCNYDAEYNSNINEFNLKMMFKLQDLLRFLLLNTDENLLKETYNKISEDNPFCIGGIVFCYLDKWYLIGADNGQGSSEWIKKIDFETAGLYGGFVLITSKMLEEEI